MKNLLYLLAGIMVSVSTKAQLQNLDFEQWDEPVTEMYQHNKPTGWIWTNSETEGPDQFFYYPPSVSKQHGNHALHLSVWYNYTKDAAIQHTSFNSRPRTLNGFYQYKHNYIMGPEGWQLDTARVSVVLTRFNPETQTTDTIAEGLVEMGEATNGFTFFSMPIYYRSRQVPDSITILLDPSLCRRNPERQYGAFGDTLAGHTSFLTIDNLWLSDEFNGLESVTSISTLSVFPNPASDFVMLESDADEVIIRDITGKMIERTKPVSGKIEVQSLSAGTYIIEIVDGNKRAWGKFVKR